MHGAVLQLMDVMRPPTGGGDQFDWSQVERDFGIKFPEDYRDFMSEYGGGVIDDFLAISTPPCEGSVYGDIFDAGLQDPSARYAEEIRLLSRNGLENKILSFAQSSSGDVLFWICEPADPDLWSVLSFTRHPVNGRKHWSLFEGGMSDLLVAAIRGQLRSVFSQVDFPSSTPLFLGWRDEMAA